MNNKKIKSTAKKLLAGLVAFMLLILPIYATNNDKQQETLDIGTSDQLPVVEDTIENTEKNKDDLEADHQVEEDKVISLGLSSIGEIEINAPNRKIPFGQTDFDLAYGVTAIDKLGADLSANLNVADDGGFDGNTAGDYIIKYSIDINGVETAAASRTITVTNYNVIADDVYFKGDTMPLKPEEIDAGMEVANHSLISGLSVIGEDENEYASYAVAVSSKSLNLQSSGTYTVDFDVVFNDEVLVQFTRDFYVSTISTFTASLGNPLFIVGERFPDNDPTYPGEYKHIYYAVNADGRIFIGNREMGREGKAEQQWWSGYSNSSALRVIRGGVETIYRLGNYIGNSAFTSVAVVKVDDQTIQVTYELPAAAAMTAVITYHLAKDSRTIDYSWTITNHGAAADVKLYYGGDTYFAGSDRGQSFYNSRTKAVYVKTSVDPVLYGMMILRASELTPLDYFFGGYYSLGNQFVVSANPLYPNLPGSHSNPIINLIGGLPGEVSTLTDIDQGLYIQWNASLAAGESVDKDAAVQITEAGNIQVIAPEGKSAPSGVKLPYTFLLENVSNVEVTGTFTVSSSNGWHIEVAGGSNTITVAAGQSIPVTVYLTVPAGETNGTKDNLTLSVTSNRVTSGSTITTIDNSLPAIQDIRIVEQTNTALKAAVDFMNVVGTRSTTVTILNEDGTTTSIPPQTKAIASGGTFDFNISGLTFNRNYIIRAVVEGIDYYSEKVFTIATIATGLTLNRGAAVAPANVNINGAASLTDSTVKATILPADVTNKNVNWTATPAGNATITATTQSGANTAITFVKNGVTTITARAAAASNPTKSMTYTVDTQNPTIGATTVTGSGSVGNPFRLTTSAADPQKDGYASGLKNIYYKTQLSTAAVPIFTPTTPTGWTLYSTTPTNFQDASGSTLAVYIVAVDNFDNYTIYKHTSNIVSDVISPVITVSDVHVLQNSTPPTFPRNASATDNVDGVITLTASHVDKTSVPTTTAGRQIVKYTVTDRSGNTAVKDQYVYIHGLPVISTKVDTIELHVNDIAADFIALTDARVGVSAKVSIVSATGVVTNNVNVPGVTVTTNNIVFGTVGTYQVTYTAAYTHANGNMASSATKTITVKVSATPTTTPTTPVISTTAGTLRSFKDYLGYQITDTAIKDNVTATGSAALPTYTILKIGGGTATISEVNASISYYTVRYRAENADGTTAYKDVPLCVYDKLTYYTPSLVHTLVSATPLVAKPLTVTFRGNEGSGIKTFTTAVVTEPANADISAAGRTKMEYSVKYPASFGTTIEETPYYYIFAHGIPIISTKVDTIELHVNDIAADFVALTDARIGVSAKVSTLTSTGIVTNDVNVPGITVTTNNIVFGTAGTYQVTYTAAYTHANGNMTSRATKTITVKVSATPPTTPTTPVISATAGTLRSFKDYTPHQITDAAIKGNVTATNSAVAPTYTILKTGGGTATIAEVNASIASYTVRYRAENADGTTAYKDVPLYVYGKLTYTAPTTEHVLVSPTPLAAKPLTVTFQGNEGGTTQTFTTAVVTKPSNANISVVGRTNMAYSVKYPASFGIAIEETPSYYIFAHGIPIISTKTDTIELHINDIAADFVALSDARVGVSAKVNTVTATGVVANDVNVPGITVTTNNINFGTVGTYQVTYTAAYTHTNGNVVSTATKTITVKVSANPTTPTTPVISATAGTLRSFKDYTPYQITDAAIKANVTATNSAALPTYTILKIGGGTATIAEVNGSIASYIVRYRAQNADGTTAYKDVPLYVYGKLTYTALTNEHVLVSATPLAAKPLTVTFQGNEGGTTQTFTTAVVANPGNANISVVGRTNMAYSVKYPASFGIAIEETPSYYIFAHGIPIISTKTDTIELHINDIAADFVALSDARVGVSAKVNTVTATGVVANDVNVPGITVTTNNINFGTVGTYQVTYTADYTHANGNVASTSTKTITVKVSATPPTTPTTPVISATAGTLRSFKDYTPYQITDAAIKANVTATGSAAVPTYTILKAGGGTATIAEVNGSIASYIVRYRAENADGTTAYKDVPLFVYGKLTYTAPTNEQLLISPTPLAAKPLTVTFQGNEGGTTQTFNTAVVTNPGNANISVVGRTNMAYSVKYPASFGIAIEETPSYYIFAQGIPEISAANSVTLVLEETAADFNNKTDPRLALSAIIKVVDGAGTVTTQTIAHSAINFAGTITYGTEGIYPVKYTTSHVHPAINGAAAITGSGEKSVNIIVTEFNPEGPIIIIDPTSPSVKDGKFWHFINAGQNLTDAEIKSALKVTLTLPATSSTFTYKVISGSNTVPLATALGAPGTYSIAYRVTDDQNRTNTAYFDLYVVGEITATNATDVHTGTNTAALETNQYHPGSTNAASGTFVSYDKTTKAAVVTVTPTTVARTNPSTVALSYKVTYPTTFPAPPTHNISKNSTVYVHGYPVITANDLTLSLFDTSLDVRNNAAIALGATAKTPTGITTTLNKAEITISYPEGPIRFGTAGTYKVKLVSTYQPHASMTALSTEKIITITISATGNPEAPGFGLSATGTDPIRYFQGFTHTSNVVDDAKVRANVETTPKPGSTLKTLSYVVLKADGSEITLANAKAQIGAYTIRYRAEDNLNRASYFTVKLHIIGEITLGTTTPIETIQGGAGAKLPEAEYKGAKGVAATFIDSDGTTKNAVVTIGDVTTSTIETKNITYTAKYPITYNNTNLEKTHTRIVRVHGLPVITASNRIDLRTGATNAQLLNGITAQVSLAPIAVGGTAVVQTVPVTVSTPQNITTIGKFQLPLTATYTLPATYSTPLILTTTANNRLVVLHGHITYTGSDITLSTNFPANDFETLGRPQMNVVAKVSYYDTTTNTVVTDTLTPIVPSSTSINFGTAGANNQVYSASDSTAANRPVGLSGVNLNKTFVVTIKAGVIGTAPVIAVVNTPINWLSTAPINKAELMSGVTANDAEDGSLTGAIAIAVKPSSGSAVPITAANTALSPGLHTAVYTVLDSQGNKIVKEVPLYVYSPMTVTGRLVDTNVRENVAQFKPDISSWKLSYTDGITGTTKVINSVSNSATVGTTRATYGIATRGNYTYNVTAKHPIFDDRFTSFTGAITIPTAVSGSGVLKVHTNIALTGYEAYNATKAGGRPTTSYFKVGQDVGDSNLLTGVTATYTNSDGNLINLFSRITVEAPLRSNSKANNFTVKYSVADDIIITNPKTTGGITVSVDSLPIVKAVKNPVYINAGGDEAEAITIANTTATIYYGLKPDVAVTLPTTKTFTYQKGTDMLMAGNKATLTATAVHPDNPSNTAKLDIPVKVYVEPSITLNGTGYLEMFKGEYTTDQIRNTVFDVEAKFTDENGVEKKLKPEIDVDDNTFADGKRYDIPAYVIDPYTKLRIETQPAVIFVLNKAYIVAKEQYQIKNTKVGYTSDDMIAIMNQSTYGVGEEVVGGTIVSRAFATAASTNQIQRTRFGVTYDLSRVKPFEHGNNQSIQIVGRFHYRNQEVVMNSKLFLIKHNSSEGTNKPDVTIPPGTGGTGTGGTGTGGTGTGGTGGTGTGGTGTGGSGIGGGNTSGNLTGGGVDGNGDYGLTGEFGLSNSAITFWQETRNLIDKVGEKDETWTIRHSDPKNPTKNSGSRSKVIAVPGEYLELPSYVINTLREQSTHRLQLNLGDYIWYLDSNAAWTNSGRTNYPIGVKSSNNGKITAILGSAIESQQLTFGFLDGWNTIAHLGVKITNEALQGEQLYMYYYNSYTGELEFVGDMEDLGSNWHSVAVKGHYGEYVITDQLLLNVRAVNMTVADNPSTGGYNYIVKYTHDMFEAGAITAPTSAQVVVKVEPYEAAQDNIWIYVAIATVGLGAAAAVIYLLKKRKESDMQ